MKKKEIRRIILEQALDAASQGEPPKSDELLALLKAAGRRVVVEQDDIKNARLVRLEEMAAARFYVFTESGLCLADVTLENVFIRSLVVGGDVLDMHDFTGKIVIKRS